MLQSIEVLDGKYRGLFKSTGGNQTERAGNTGYDPRGDFLNFWGWYAVVDDVTGGDPFKEDEVWSWGVVRFLNRLSYMKDKNEVIAEEIRQRNGIKR